MSDLGIALSFFAMMLSPCLLARLICISERRAAALRVAARMKRADQSGSWQISTVR